MIALLKIGNRLLKTHSRSLISFLKIVHTLLKIVFIIIVYPEMSKIAFRLLKILVWLLKIGIDCTRFIHIYTCRWSLLLSSPVMRLGVLQTEMWLRQACIFLRGMTLEKTLQTSQSSWSTTMIITMWGPGASKGISRIVLGTSIKRNFKGGIDSLSYLLRDCRILDDSLSTLVEDLNCKKLISKVSETCMGFHYEIDKMIQTSLEVEHLQEAIEPRIM